MSDDTAEAYARMAPLAQSHPYPMALDRMRRHLEVGRKLMTRWLRELEQKGYVIRIGRNSWEIVEDKLWQSLKS